MILAITYGTYDLLHPGHIRLLRRAREMCDYLIVGLSTDEFNAKKKKKAVLSYEERKEVLASIIYVDAIIPEHSWDQKRADIIEADVDLFIMGSDWAGKFDDLQDICDVVYLPRTIGISTTDVKKRIK